MQTLVEDFLQYLRHERGQAEHTQRTYAALLNKFVAWAREQGLSDWKAVELRHVMSYLNNVQRRSRDRGCSNHFLYGFDRGTGLFASETAPGRHRLRRDVRQRVPRRLEGGAPSQPSKACARPAGGQAATQ